MILEKIKAATAANHHSIENTPLMLPLTNQAITRPHYGKILARFYGYFSPLEEALNQTKDLSQHLRDFPQRRKAHLLLDDLHMLGLSKENIPVCSELPLVTTLSQAFGTLYVLEGSTLGGQYISRMVKKNLKLADGEGTLFFEGYGKETGSRWKLFQQALLSYSENLHPSEEDLIIETANEIFARFENWLKDAHLQQINI